MQKAPPAVIAVEFDPISLDISIFSWSFGSSVDGCFSFSIDIMTRLRLAAAARRLDEDVTVISSKPFRAQAKPFPLWGT